YGLTKWDDLFNIRQKLALITFMHKIRGNYQRIKEDCHTIGLEKYGIDYKEAAKAVSGYLAIILDRLADHNSSLNLWQAGRESMKNTFGRQSLPMVWDYAEVNPFSGSTGDWNGAIDWVKRVIDTTCAGVLSKIIHVTNDSAVKLSFPATFFDAVFTDPPYYDNVPYADLSDFFYVWLKRTVGDLFPNIFATPLTPKENEIVQLAKLNKKYSYKTKEFFEENLTRSFREINRVLKPGGIAVIVYAHRTTAGWETMLNSLINAGLVVTASWPIHTEMKSRLIARASATLASSIYMVCRKLPREKIGFYNELQPLVEERIRSKLQQFWDAGIAGGDFFVSAIGPAMEIFSKFERIEKYSGEAVRVTNFLKYIRTVSTRFIVDKLLKGTSPTEIDKESQFYLTYRWTYLDNRVEFSDARKLAIASGVNLEELWDKNGFVQKSGSNISVLGPNQRKTIEKSRNMVDIMHQTVLLWEKGKRDEIDELMTKTGHKTNPAFWQFCQAVAECLLMGNKEKQLLEGFLLGKDNYMRDRRKDNRLKGLDQFLGA
ncbi:MAG: DUF1156 domain-containing protein, partial [Candidatus Zixiibacteriota bacterium]